MSRIQKAARNEACPCGSGKKYKRCHGAQQGADRGNKALMIIIGLLLAGGVAAGVTKFMNPDRGKPMGVWSAEHGHYH